MAMASKRKRYTLNPKLSLKSYTVVEYFQGIVEVLSSNKVKKQNGYAIAKHCQANVLYESGKYVCYFIMHYNLTLNLCYR